MRASALLLIALAGACTSAPVTVVPVPLEGAEASATAPTSPTRAFDGSRPEATVTLAGTPVRPATPADALATRALILPVAGADAAKLRDSFGDARDGGERRHNAIDIMAPRGAAVLAADEGRVVRMSTNTLGGIIVYAFDPSETFVYYYAHLDRYHPALTEGRRLARGDTIGFVGTTGNAPENVPHLHFQVMLMPVDRRYWEGEPINPYPFLRRSGEWR
jgi:murein DD-endopeptidase MepM/ murein hydrolase activator NlpD